MTDHNYFSNLIWQIADLLRGPYRPPQYERVMLPMTVLRRFDCVLAPTKAKVLADFDKRKGGKLNDDALDRLLNKSSGQRFHNHSPLDFEKLKGDPDNIEKHFVSYIKGFSANVRRIFDFFDFFEFENEIEKMRESNILYLVVSKFCDVDLHPKTVPNEQMGLIFENLIRRFNELANETAGDHFTPREVIRTDRLSSEAIVGALAEAQDSPWPDRRPPTKVQLARRLAPFGIRPTIVHRSRTQVSRGYLLEDCRDAFARYVRNPSARSGQSLKTAVSRSFSQPSSTSLRTEIT